MVETITPVVHGGRARWMGALLLHALGATAAAAVFGAALGGIGRMLGAPWGRAGLLAAAVAAAKPQVQTTIVEKCQLISQFRGPRPSIRP